MDRRKVQTIIGAVMPKDATSQMMGYALAATDSLSGENPKTRDQLTMILGRSLPKDCDGRTFAFALDLIDALMGELA